VFDVVLWRLLDIDGMDTVDSVVTVVGKNGAANDFFLEELLNVDSLSSVSATLSSLIEKFFHLIIHGVVSKNSTGEVNEHLNFHSVIHVNRGLVARPDVEIGFSDLMLKILRFLIKLGVGSDLEKLLILKKIFHHNVHKLKRLIFIDSYFFGKKIFESHF
jgi:hypothetical protein